MLKAEIVDLLDNNPAKPSDRADIAYLILMETNRRILLVNDVLLEYRLGFADKSQTLRLKRTVREMRMRESNDIDISSLHLLWGVLPNEDYLDGILAEYYYAWAERLGIDEDRVSKIIWERVFRPSRGSIPISGG